jgi:hypothetical protein
MEIQIFRKIMEFILTLAVISPLSFMLEDEHRSSMGEESLHHLWQMLCKYYVEKIPEGQKKKNEKWKNMMRRKKSKGKRKNKVRKRKRENEKEMK